MFKVSYFPGEIDKAHLCRFLQKHIMEKVFENFKKFENQEYLCAKFPTQGSRRPSISVQNLGVNFKAAYRPIHCVIIPVLMFRPAQCFVDPSIVLSAG